MNGVNLGEQNGLKHWTYLTSNLKRHGRVNFHSIQPNSAKNILWEFSLFSSLQNSRRCEYLLMWELEHAYFHGRTSVQSLWSNWHQKTTTKEERNIGILFNPTASKMIVQFAATEIWDDSYMQNKYFQQLYHEFSMSCITSCKFENWK